MPHALTIDVEDWFQVQALSGVIPRETWDDQERRVDRNTERLLDLFAEHGVFATFFCLGWVAERHPRLIRRIVAQGHELASHGHGHHLVDALGPQRFREDVRRARLILEDTGGVRVRGYRAPTFSIGPRTPWAHEILEDEGHTYSSSVYPVRHDLYGDPTAPRQPFRPRPDGALVEVPMTTLRLRGRNLPCGGGGWFRLLPPPLFHGALRRVSAEGHRALFYLHPWEIDPGQPRVQGLAARSRFRHYLNLHRCERRLSDLLSAFTWDRLDRVFPEVAAPLPCEEHHERHPADP